MNDVSKGKNDSKEEKKGIMMSMRVMRINISDFQKKKKDANDCRFEARNHWMPPIAACIFFFFLPISSARVNVSLSERRIGTL